MDERMVIERVLKGETDAFGELVREHQSRVRACLVVRLHDSSAVDDLAQEAFLIAYRKLAEFDAERDFGPWVRTIAIRCMQNYIRKKRPRSAGASSELDQLIDYQIDKNNPVELNADEDRLKALSTCLNKLDTDQRFLIEGRYFQKKAIADIRKVLGVAHSTLTMRLHRLREGLRSCIEQQLDVGGAS
jgi:RNA polymerase sigma-70 factor (ECF subfamily)